MTRTQSGATVAAKNASPTVMGSADRFCARLIGRNPFRNARQNQTTPIRSPIPAPTTKGFHAASTSPVEARMIAGAPKNRARMMRPDRMRTPSRTLSAPYPSSSRWRQPGASTKRRMRSRFSLLCLRGISWFRKRVGRERDFPEVFER